ncbi:hypothetical protein [Qipengyuania sp. JC766]
MTRFFQHSVAALAAFLITVTAFNATVSVPPADAAIATVSAPELA